MLEFTETCRTLYDEVVAADEEAKLLASGLTKQMLQTLENEEDPGPESVDTIAIVSILLKNWSHHGSWADIRSALRPADVFMQDMASVDPRRFTPSAMLLVEPLLSSLVSPAESFKGTAIFSSMAIDTLAQWATKVVACNKAWMAYNRLIKARAETAGLDAKATASALLRPRRLLREETASVLGEWLPLMDARAAAIESFSSVDIDSVLSNILSGSSMPEKARDCFAAVKILIHDDKCQLEWDDLIGMMSPMDDFLRELRTIDLREVPGATIERVESLLPQGSLDIGGAAASAVLFAHAASKYATVCRLKVCPLITQLLESDGSASDKIETVFKTWDKSNNGFISQDELVEVLQSIKSGWTDRQLHSLIAASGALSEEGGQVDYVAFLQSISGTSAPRAGPAVVPVAVN